MGLFSSKTKTKTDMTTTSTPQTPAYMDRPLSDAWGRVHEIGGMDPSQFVAGLSDLQKQAGEGAAGLGRGGMFGDAASMTRSILGGGDPSASSGQWGGVDKYMDPYIGQVVDATMARNNQNRGMGMEANRLRYSGGRAGSNEAIAGALTAGQYDLNDQQAIGGLLSSGFGQAAQLADNQAQRDNAVNMQNAQLGAQMFGQRLAGAGQMANIGTAEGADARANIGTQADIGDTFQQTDQAQRGAPLTMASWQIDAYGRLVPAAGLQTGQTQHQVGTQTTSGGGGVLGGLLSTAGTLGMGAGALGWKPFG